MLYVEKEHGGGPDAHNFFLTDPWGAGHTLPKTSRSLFSQNQSVPPPGGRLIWNPRESTHKKESQNIFPASLALVHFGGFFCRPFQSVTLKKTSHRGSDYVICMPQWQGQPGGPAARKANRLSEKCGFDKAFNKL